MHYSEKLKAEVKVAENRISAAEAHIQQFRKHLTSEKFHKDTTIQVKDVENWLLNILDDLRGIA